LNISWPLSAAAASLIGPTHIAIKKIISAATRHLFVKPEVMFASRSRR
jgi:hypothetical protein